MASASRLLLVALLLCSSSVCHLSSPVSAEKVPLALYYETLCPYCSNFIVNYLSRIFQSGLISIIDLDLIPYGNARIGPNETISCQHGPYECLLNTVEACAINAWPDLDVHFKFIYCVENLVVEHKYLEWETCFEKTGLDSYAVLDCYESGHGQKLELQYAAQTDALEPPHRYVPWVVVNRQPLYDDYENFEAYVCKAYNGDPPVACSGVSLKFQPETRANEHVTYADATLDSSVARENNQMDQHMVA